MTNLQELCRTLSKHWLDFAKPPEALRALVQQRRRELGTGGYKIFTETAAAAYALHEVDSLLENTLISNLNFYPFLTYSIIAALRKAAEKTLHAHSTVTFFSTMLPRHYYMFPHALAGKFDDIPFHSLCYPERFVDDYKDRLSGMIADTTNTITFRRYTVVMENPRVQNDWAMSPPVALAANDPPPLLDDFMADAKRSLSSRVRLDSITPTGATHADIAYSVGVADAWDDDFDPDWLKEAIPRTVSEINLFCSDPQSELPSLVGTFAKKFHSPSSCRLLIVIPTGHKGLGPEAPDLSPLARLGVYPKLCNLSKFRVSPDSVHFSLDGGTGLEACLIANIELRNKSVALRYFSSDYEAIHRTDDSTEVNKLGMYRDFIAKLESDRATDCAGLPDALPTGSGLEIAALFDKLIDQFQEDVESEVYKDLVALKKTVVRHWRGYTESVRTCITKALNLLFYDCQTACSTIQKCVPL
jgi:hypothetical protein